MEDRAAAIAACYKILTTRSIEIDFQKDNEELSTRRGVGIESC